MTILTHFTSFKLIRATFGSCNVGADVLQQALDLRVMRLHKCTSCSHSRSKTSQITTSSFSERPFFCVSQYSLAILLYVISTVQFNCFFKNRAWLTRDVKSTHQSCLTMIESSCITTLVSGQKSANLSSFVYLPKASKIWSSFGRRSPV